MHLHVCPTFSNKRLLGMDKKINILPRPRIDKYEFCFLWLLSLEPTIHENLQFADSFKRNVIKILRDNQILKLHIDNHSY